MTVPIPQRQSISVHPLVRQLRDERKSRGITIKQLAKRAGYRENCIGEYERGKRRVFIHALTDMAGAMGLAINIDRSGVTEFRIELPLPPTANNAYPTNWQTKRRYLSKRGMEWKDEAGWLITLAKPPKIDGTYTFQILIPEKARGDSDGYVKLPQDLLAELGITPNDRKAQDSRGTRDPSVKPKTCVLVVRSWRA